MKEIRTILKQYDSIDQNKEKVALASVVQVEASAYRRIGARMLVQSSGIWTGGISGGCLEGDALRRSQKAIFENKVATVVYDTMEDDNHQIGVGLGCNGRIEVLLSPIDHADPNNEIEILRRIKDDTKANLILKVVEHSDASLKGKVHLVEDNVDLLKIPGIDEKELATNLAEVRSRRKAKLYSFGEDEEIKILIEFLRPETHLVIAGDNYDIYAMLGIATQLGWRSTVLGKAKKLTKQVYQDAKQVLDYSEIDKVEINEYTAIILMSHDYNHDLALVEKLMDSNAAYMGILGPKKRFEKLDGDIEKDLSALSFIHSPTGLEIGAESPEEIALSICAEIVAKMRDKVGGSLHLRKKPIHDPD